MQICSSLHTSFSFMQPIWISLSTLVSLLFSFRLFSRAQFDKTCSINIIYLRIQFSDVAADEVRAATDDFLGVGHFTLSQLRGDFQKGLHPGHSLTQLNKQFVLKPKQNKELIDQYFIYIRGNIHWHACLCSHFKYDVVFITLHTLNFLNLWGLKLPPESICTREWLALCAIIVVLLERMTITNWGI